MVTDKTCRQILLASCLLYTGCMPSVVSRLNADMSLEIPEVQVHRDPFPSELCSDLHRLIMGQDGRKARYVFTSDKTVPDEITRARLYVPFMRGNVAITKRYDPTNDPSEAFVWHRDPEEFGQRPIVLCTLGGYALLTLRLERDEERLLEIECRPNTAVVVHDNLTHMVSPPLHGKARTFLFNGESSSEPHILQKWHDFLADRQR
jgi:hypothetical protein